MRHLEENYDVSHDDYIHIIKAASNYIEDDYSDFDFGSLEDSDRKLNHYEFSALN